MKEKEKVSVNLRPVKYIENNYYLKSILEWHLNAV